MPFTSEYPIINVTVDAVVVHDGEVLLIERKSDPGKGKWALPGGFVNYRERLHEAMLRELKEETGVTWGPVASCNGPYVFDTPYRSSRGRTITNAFHLALTHKPDLTAGDDATRAFWFPIIRLLPKYMFEDHYHIINVLYEERYDD